MDSKEELKLTLKMPPRGKGLMFKCSADTSNGGFYANCSKYGVELCLFFVAFRLFFMSEEYYDALRSITTFKKICDSHDLSIVGLNNKTGENS